jgi:raffinose/stachyose/melibiose transport system permease protein
MPSAPKRAGLPPTDQRPRRSRSTRPSLWLAVPAVSIYVFIVIIPSIQSIVLSTTNWNGVSTDREFVGLENYQAMLTTGQGWTALRNTIIIAVAYTILVNVFGLLLAVALDTQLKTRNFLRTVFFAPVVFSALIIGYVFKYIFSPRGPLNEFLEMIGLGDLAQPWLAKPAWGLTAIVITCLWQNVGIAMVIYLAGLQGVPRELLEAAAIDGAAAWGRFRHVTLPLIAPAITVNVMLSLIGGLRIFDQVYALTKGGPAGQTNTISTLMVQQTFQYAQFGYGTALAVMLGILVAVLGSIQYRVLRKQAQP